MPLSSPYISQINYIDNYNKNYKNTNNGYSISNRKRNYKNKYKKSNFNINNSKSIRNISNYNYIF